MTLLRLALDCSATTHWQIQHPNYGWMEVDCPCDAVDVSSFLRQLGQEPWLIRLGDGYDGPDISNKMRERNIKQAEKRLRKLKETKTPEGIYNWYFKSVIKRKRRLSRLEAKVERN